MEYSITMPYIGGILSENAYKFKTRGTKPFVKLWMCELAEKVRLLETPKVEKYEVGVFGRFSDERRPDIPNLFKIVLDAVAKGLDINDKNFTAKDNGYKLGFFDPELVITVEPLPPSYCPHKILKCENAGHCENTEGCLEYFDQREDIVHSVEEAILKGQVDSGAGGIEEC